jgi:hypothetical protein
MTHPIRRKLWNSVALAALLWMVIYILPGWGQFTRIYDKAFFYPFQSLRSSALSAIPFSIGDVLYILGGMALLSTIIRWVYFIARFRSYKQHLLSSVISTLNAALGIYLLFFIGWGANYNKPPLSHTWELGTLVDTSLSKDERKASALASSIAFNKFLLGRINEVAPHYVPLPFGEVNKRAQNYYRLYTNSPVRDGGIGIKTTMFGYFMERMEVEGYYNPFTGEGQVNTDLPSFVMPFLICHEMAHQAGIAAEDDANLMAYALGTTTTDPSFNYSAYLNIWQYANMRLFRRDSVIAKQLEAQLNPLTRAHLDTLDQIYRKFHGQVSRYSSEFYDNYLKLQQQKDGIRSYGNVATSAWQLELKRQKQGVRQRIDIP